MDENPGASESDAGQSDPPDPDPDSGPSPRVRASHAPGLRTLLAAALFLGCSCRSLPAGGFEQVRASGTLRYGSDMEGGGPYAFPDPKAPREVTGFEVELMALLGKEL